MEAFLAIHYQDCMQHGLQNARAERPVDRGAAPLPAPDRASAPDRALRTGAHDSARTDDESSGTVIVAMALCAISGAFVGFLLGLGAGLAI